MAYSSAMLTMESTSWVPGENLGDTGFEGFWAEHGARFTGDAGAGGPLSVEDAMRLAKRGSVKSPILKFPHNIEDDEYGHYISFHFMVDLTNKGASPLEAKLGYGFETPTTFTDSRAATAPGGGSLASGIGALAVDVPAGIDAMAVRRTAGGYILNKLGVSRPRIVRSTTSISMFIPENIGTKYEHTYTDHSPGGLITTVLGTGAGGADADRLRAAFEGAVDRGVGNFSAIAASVKNTISAVTGSQSAKAFGLAMAEGTRGAFGGIGALPSAIVRQTFNPRMEFLYTKTGTRTFEYSFKMIPRNYPEAKTIREIIQAFKIHSHPRIEDKFGNFLHFPNQFEIEYMSYGKENKFLNRISTCVLTGMNINYNTENRMQFMRALGSGESPPMTTTMVLSFKELEILTANRAEQGY